MNIKTDIVLKSDSSRITFEIDKPNVCPICKQSGDHSLLGKNINQEDYVVSITLECTMCYEIFFAKYDVVTPREKFSHFNNPVQVVLKETFPLQKVESHLPEEMKDLFPDFEEIYVQALSAESNGLHLITGIAFRKSLEYLVKLYLITKSPSDEEEIRNEFLGKSIKRIEYPIIQKLATAATWLGNDEGHFTRKHLNYDVSDMKRFILSLSHLIVAEKVAEDAAELVD
ncbi:hypothetical protein B481_2033 [Planococcus halocryophilus Or1]|uniref:DUF4145 domain-containing protein n=1 Tax=Planococcus halocryophilus TaxID=1215089 RepID=A0A1C7DPS0_9BACL|nr:hypothetical protein [Planococcus halocryophilus]ANU13496.1 hypothetical protein BBI08_06420 [Planococcus halocryophilus]EMF46306.1 hypothetical protein B481_2033 [Planococcus halocryophilus Or1]